jgi:hypothetical protein
MADRRPEGVGGIAARGVKAMLDRDAALAMVARLNEENTALVRRVAAFELIASEALSLLAHLGKVTLPSRDLDREGADVTQEVARLRAAMEAVVG